MEKQTIRYSLPLKPEEVTNIFLKSNEIDFEISVDGQDPKTALMFLKNLKKPVTVVEFDRDFLRTYMTTEHLVWAKNLAKVHANVLYWNKYGHVLFEDVLGEFSINDIESFVTSESELVDSHREFLEALPLFLTVSTMIKAKEIEERDGTIKVVRDDEQAMMFIEKAIPPEHIIEEETPLLGFNLVQVCALEDYLFRYIDEADIAYMLRGKWFAKFFEEYKFDKKYLIAWLEPTSFAQNVLGMFRYLDEGNYKVKEGFAVPSFRDRASLKIKNIFGLNHA